MLIQTLVNTNGLTDRDFDQIFEIAGTRVAHASFRLDRRDLEIAFGHGTVMFAARERSGKTKHIHGLATLCPIHTGIQREGIVMSIVVPGPYRGRQIGIRLIEAILDYSVKERFSRLRLLHPGEDPDADRVFREHGFELEHAEWLYTHRRER